MDYFHKEHLLPNLIYQNRDSLMGPYLSKTFSSTLFTAAGIFLCTGWTSVTKSLLMQKVAYFMNAHEALMAINIYFTT